MDYKVLTNEGCDDCAVEGEAKEATPATEAAPAEEASTEENA